jgi:hypothetical protein
LIFFAVANSVWVIKQGVAVAYGANFWELFGSLERGASGGHFGTKIN